MSSTADRKHKMQATDKPTHDRPATPSSGVPKPFVPRNSRNHSAKELSSLFSTGSLAGDGRRPKEKKKSNVASVDVKSSEDSLLELARYMMRELDKEEESEERRRKLPASFHAEQQQRAFSGRFVPSISGLITSSVDLLLQWPCTT